MTNRLFNKITAFIRPLNRPQALTTMLLSNLAKFSLIVAMREGGMGASFGSCLNIAPVTIVHWIKIGAAWRPHLFKDLSNRMIKFHPSLKLPFETATFIETNLR